MLALAFHIGPDRFALGCADVIEVVPHVELRLLPHAPEVVAGVFTYRGAIAPVIDLCRLIRGTPCPDRLSSRIIVVRTEGRLIGLLAERVVETIELEPATAIRGGLSVPGAPYLGDIFVDASHHTQQLLLAGILHGPLRAMLEAGA